MSIYAPKTSKNHPTSKQMHKNHHVRFWGSSIPDFSDPPSGTVSREHLLTFLQWFNSLEPASNLVGRGWRGRNATILSSSLDEGSTARLFDGVDLKCGGTEMVGALACLLCAVALFVGGGGGTIYFVSSVPISCHSHNGTKEAACGRERRVGRLKVGVDQQESMHWSRRASGHPNSR